jgi:hypothetical protein
MSHHDVQGIALKWNLDVDVIVDLHPSRLFSGWLDHVNGRDFSRGQFIRYGLCMHAMTS